VRIYLGQAFTYQTFDVYETKTNLHPKDPWKLLTSPDQDEYIQSTSRSSKLQDDEEARRSSMPLTNLKTRRNGQPTTGRHTIGDAPTHEALSAQAEKTGRMLSIKTKSCQGS
jgi:hypothetical protein